MTHSLPWASTPNSYLVSTRIRPRCFAHAWPAANRSRAMRAIWSHCFCETLERDGGEDPVESAEPVGSDHHDPIALRIVVAHLAPVELAQQREIGLAQRVRKLGAQGLVHCGSSGTAQDSACAVAIRPQPAA